MIDGPKFSDIEKKKNYSLFQVPIFFSERLIKEKKKKKCDIKIILPMVIYDHYYKHMMKKDDKKE